MSRADPAVSICIPTYNYGRYLSDALDSALAQTFADIEIVVVDNCSDDGTPELVSEYCRRDGRVVFHRNAGNIGMTGNFNRAMELARGKYVKFLCADDVLASGCVERLVEAMEANPGVALAACKREIFRTGRPVFRSNPKGIRARVTAGTQAIRDCFFVRNYIGEPTAVLFRKSDVVSGFDDRYYQALDVDMWFRLLENGSLAYIDDALCGVREHDSTGTAKNLRAGRITADKVRLFEHYAHKAYLRGTIAEKIRWDARMASSVAKQAAAGAGVEKEAARSAMYFPRFSGSMLISLAAVLVKLGGSAVSGPPRRP